MAIDRAQVHFSLDGAPRSTLSSHKEWCGTGTAQGTHSSMLPILNCALLLNGVFPDREPSSSWDPGIVWAVSHLACPIYI